jgi:hypothetical protein
LGLGLKFNPTNQKLGQASRSDNAIKMYLNSNHGILGYYKNRALIARQILLMQKEKYHFSRIYHSR